MRAGSIILLLVTAALLWFWLWGEQGPRRFEQGRVPAELRFHLTGLNGEAQRAASLRLEGPGLKCRFFRPDAKGCVTVADTLRREGLYRLEASAAGCRALRLDLRGEDLRVRGRSGSCSVILLPPWPRSTKQAFRALWSEAPDGRARWRWQPPAASSVLLEQIAPGAGPPRELPGAGHLEVTVVRRLGHREEASRLVFDLLRAHGAWKPLPRIRIATELIEGHEVAVSQGGEPGPFFVGLRHLRVGPQGIIEIADMRPNDSAENELRWLEGGLPRRRLLSVP